MGRSAKGAIRGWLGESVRFGRVCARGSIYKIRRFPRDRKLIASFLSRLLNRMGDNRRVIKKKKEREKKKTKRYIDYGGFEARIDGWVDM